MASSCFHVNSRSRNHEIGMNSVVDHHVAFSIEMVEGGILVD